VVDTIGDKEKNTVDSEAGVYVEEQGECGYGVGCYGLGGGGMGIGSPLDEYGVCWKRIFFFFFFFFFLRFIVYFIINIINCNCRTTQTMD
jgi:hypothetical protein